MTDRRVWISLGLVAALILSLGVYYWIHKPVASAQASALMAVRGRCGRGISFHARSAVGWDAD